MAKVRNSHLKHLAPYLVGEQPREDGEWDMHCPMHEDYKRSAQINVERGVWFCHAGCGGGRVSDLIRRRAEWVSPSAAASNGSHRSSGSKVDVPTITESQIDAWCDLLFSDKDLLGALTDARGLTEETLELYEIGWDRNQNAYTIPVRSLDGEILNVRRYQLNPKNERRKIWSVDGMGEPRLYPCAVLEQDPKEILICEGEWDALISIQNGVPAITRTGSATTWKMEWGEHFQDKTVFVCHDRDDAGDNGNRKVARALEHIAASVRIVELPYNHTKKHGKDLTDFWLEHDADDWDTVKAAAHRGKAADQEPEVIDPDPGSVLDAFDSKRAGKPLKLTVTIKGKRDPGYSIPKQTTFSCTRDAGQKCNACPMYPAGGEARVTIPEDSPSVLELMDSTKGQLNEIMRRYLGAQKCTKLSIEVESHQAVEVLFARPSVEHSHGGEAADYKNIKLTSVGRHDTMPNNTVEVIGALHPDPRRQQNEFLAWDISTLETTLDTFEASAKERKLMERFRPTAKQTPLQKLGEISRSLASHVTHIYGRPEMHAMIDLVFHSAIAFNFNGKNISRGWLEGLIVGDTRTGKSEAVTRLTRHYSAGEVVNCESASFAGIVGGLQQYGASKEWSMTWGAIPINDRRLVALDEISGLSPEEIAGMSDVRSSGIAKITKIQSEAARARTRLLWLGNPRNARMKDYTYGVQAITPLIGNAEDIARFDLAMSVMAGEVSLDVINAPSPKGSTRYTAEACHALIRWTWSRSADQIEFAPGAEDLAMEEAKRLADSYTEDPPLIQGANVREKIARVAVALAARLYSTRDGETLLVTREHVRDAVAFIDHLYGMKGFGYKERSAESLGDAKRAYDLRGDVKLYLYNRKGLAKFLRDAGRFRRQDLEEVLDISREEAHAIISKLYDTRMVKKIKGDIHVQPQLHELLREVKV